MAGCAEGFLHAGTVVELWVTLAGLAGCVQGFFPVGTVELEVALAGLLGGLSVCSSSCLLATAALQWGGGALGVGECHGPCAVDRQRIAESLAPTAIHPPHPVRKLEISRQRARSRRAGPLLARMAVAPRRQSSAGGWRRTGAEWL